MHSLVIVIFIHRVKVEVEMGEMVESRVANNPARVKTAVALAVRQVSIC